MPRAQLSDETRSLLLERLERARLRRKRAEEAERIDIFDAARMGMRLGELAEFYGVDPTPSWPRNHAG